MVAFVPPFAIGKVSVTPVVRGNPVALVRVAEDGVPRAGVTRVGDVDNTTEPVPVLVVTPVPPDATGNVPDVSAEVLVAYKAPLDVNEVNPVPPLVVANVPARVTAPEVGEDGVKPVLPALKEDTARVDGFAHAGAPAATVKT